MTGSSFVAIFLIPRMERLVNQQKITLLKLVTKYYDEVQALELPSWKNMV